MNKEEFLWEVKKLGIEITKVHLNQLDKYYQLLINWNKKINLTSIVEEKEVYLKHFYDSLTLIKAINLNKNLKICDVGSGAGFPGIVLKIFFPNLNITLIDSLNKRINFLNIVIAELGLTNIETFHARMEEFSLKHIEEYDYIVARAVSKTTILCEISSLSLKIGGKLVLMKGNNLEEIENIDERIKILSLKLEEKINFNLPIENSVRSLLIIKKQSKTNNKYPRRIDKIKKNPL